MAYNRNSLCKQEFYYATKLGRLGKIVNPARTKKQRVVQMGRNLISGAK
jgi:hypothetical protein